MSRSLALVALVLGLGSLLTACGTEQVATAPVVTTPAIQDGSIMEPGRPKLDRLPDSVATGAVQPITWNMWWGENGQHWALYVNGVEVNSGELTAATPKAQQATIELPLDRPGAYEIKVALCNDHGCSESEPALLNVSAG